MVAKSLEVLGSSGTIARAPLSERVAGAEDAVRELVAKLVNLVLEDRDVACEVAAREPRFSFT